MALFDDQWFTGLQTVITAAVAAAVAVGGTFLSFRKRLRSDASENFDERRKRSWLDDAFEQHAETRKRLEELLDDHDKDTHTIGQLEAQLGAAMALEEERGRQLAACTERIRSLSEHVLELNITLDKVYGEMARLDPDAAARLSIERWRPVGKGPNPP